MSKETNRVLINNFHQQAYTLGLESDNGKNKHKALVGFHDNSNQKELRARVVSDIFQSLLLHDKIVIVTSELTDIIDAFGLADTIELLKSERFELIDNKVSQDVISITNDQLRLDAFQIAKTARNYTINNSIEWLEDKLVNKNLLNKTEVNLLLINAEKYNIDINLKLIDEITEKEINFDLNNNYLTQYLDISTKSHDNIHKKDAFSILRLASMNKSLAYASSMSIDSLVVDAEIKSILGKKISPALIKDQSINLYDSYFEELFNKKNIPDLSSLYIRKVITLKDYLKIVSNFSSKKFRDWVRDKSFNIYEMESDLLKSAPQLSNNFIKFIRWITPDAIGFINPVAGIAASFADSYIIERFMQGWHPNIFLDDVLKKTVDKKIVLHKEIERQEAIKTKFPDIDRNDKCPCNSGKKFKKCCGK